MSIYNYIQSVKSVLESLTAPESNDFGTLESITDRMIYSLDKTMPSGGIITSFYDFKYINTTFYDEWFHKVADEHGVIWAYWKTIQIPELMELALKDYFSREGPIECVIEDWRELGLVVMESIYAVQWPESCVQKPPDCSICLSPMYRSITTSCGHSYHYRCFEEWIIDGKKNNCPLCRKKL